ncbi:hypothetical protein K4K57_000093 [Colletotrichum sp. SAR 10_99]|nr:hypothetical protein K4K57_000093 [Colletotrichum sp. SAR 10_99]
MTLASIPIPPPGSILEIGLLAISAALILRVVYNLYFHPLSKYHGPWYAASFSLVHALISVMKYEPEWMLWLSKQYGTDKPIRVAPTLLLFPQSAALKDIYWDPKCNNKSMFYGTGSLGPPHLFSTLDGNVHKSLRKALGGPQWSIGGLKNNWEPRFDSHIQLFISRMSDFARNNEPVILSDKVAEFAADIMTMVSFTDPWGFVTNSRDERNMLASWRRGLFSFGFVNRFRWLRDRVTHVWWGHFFLPSTSDDVGMGYLMAQADRQVSERERRMEEEAFTQEKPDFMQLAIEARIDGKPLTSSQKRAHVTLLIQAGADTTGTALGSTLRFLLTHPLALARARAEISAADQAGHLSPTIQYEETRTHLPFFVACIKEAIRLHPSATNLFARVAPAGGKVVDGTWVPAGAEITANAWVVQRDPRLYGPDPEAFRPERWLEGEVGGNTKEAISEMEACIFAFGIGPRVCLGKDVAYMEMYKLLPEHRAQPHLRACATRAFTTSRSLRNDAAAVNHYETLKVAHDASPAEIKKSFYALSKTHHPDHNPNDPSATRKFHAIAEAYSILGTPAKRSAYDRSLPSSHHHHGARRGSYHSSSTGPAGGRPASGLSRRRTTFRGPPPSFYRSGGWGEHSAKRRAAHESNTASDATGAEPERPGMGFGQDPYAHKRSADVRHFDSRGHTQTQARQDSRRAHRIMGQEVTVGHQETSVGAFLSVAGMMFFAFFVPYMIFVGPRKDKKKA